MYVENVEGLQATFFGADYEIILICPINLFKSSGKRASNPVQEVLCMSTLYEDSFAKPKGRFPLLTNRPNLMGHLLFSCTSSHKR